MLYQLINHHLSQYLQVPVKFFMNCLKYLIKFLHLFALDSCLRLRSLPHILLVFLMLLLFLERVLGLQNVVSKHSKGKSRHSVRAKEKPKHQKKERWLIHMRSPKKLFTLPWMYSIGKCNKARNNKQRHRYFATKFF